MENKTTDIKKLYKELLRNSKLAELQKPIPELVVETPRQLQAETSQNGVIKTGFQDLDKLIGGFLPGEFIIIGGRPAMGKTSFLVDLSLNISENYPLFFETLELDDWQLTQRFISSHVEIPIRKIEQPQTLTLAECEQIDSKMKKIADSQLFILGVDMNNAISFLKAHCEKQIKENGVKVIVIDYLQLVSWYQRKEDNKIDMSFVCQELKNIAKENNVCVIVSSQLKRDLVKRIGNEGKRPQLSDLGLRESDAIMQNADKVIFLHRPEYYEIYEDESGNDLTGIAEIIVAKNNNGVTGNSVLRFDKEIPKFSNFANSI